MCTGVRPVGHQINHGGVETVAPTSTSFAEVVGNEFPTFKGSVCGMSQRTIKVSEAQGSGACQATTNKSHFSMPSGCPERFIFKNSYV